MTGQRSQASPPGAQGGAVGGKPGRGRLGGRRPDGAPDGGKPRIVSQDNPGWAIFGYLLSGMAVYGGIGWLIGRWAGHQPMFLALGMVIGLALAIMLTILRYGRS